MGHIHTKAGQVDQTVSAYVLRRDGDDVYVLLHMHRKLKKLLPVGGHIELHETPWSAIAHELKEESGYSLDEVAILQPSTRIADLQRVVLHPQPFVVQTHEVTEGHFHTDMGYIFEAEAYPRGEIGEGESQDIRWLTREGVASLGEDVIWDDTREMCLEIFDKFINNWQPVSTTEFLTITP